MPTSKDFNYNSPPLKKIKRQAKNFHMEIRKQAKFRREV